MESSEQSAENPLSEGVFSILKYGDRRLNQKCTEVKSLPGALSLAQKLWLTIDYLKTLYNFTKGCGLSAPQVGHLIRVAIVEYAGTRYTLINPSIVEHSSDTFPSREGCLSFFDYRAVVTRWKNVTVEAIGLDQKASRFRVSGECSAMVQHELDHLDFKLLTDYFPNGLADCEHVTGKPVIP